MEFNQLHYFQVVARCESITRAAEELHITQSALSKVIARLEAELGHQLFDREKKRIRLNQNGIQLLDFATSTFAGLDRLKGSMTEHPSAKISCAYSNSWYMQHQLEYCCALYPDLELEVVEASPDECFCRLENSQSNLAILPMPLDISSGWEPLYQEKWCVIYHKLRTMPTVAGVAYIEDLENQPLVYCGDGGSYRFLLRAFQRHNITPNFVMETENASLAAMEINRAAAAAIVPFNVFYRLMQTCPQMPIQAVRLIDGNLQRNIYIRQTEQYPQTPRAMEFYNQLKEIMQEYQATVESYMDAYFSRCGDIPPKA